MFPSNQDFQISFNPTQENTIPEDLILIPGHGAVVDATTQNNKSCTAKTRQKNPCFSHQDHGITTDPDYSKRVMHKDIEKQRRREMATLYTKLRNLLPLEYIKGKRATSDHVLETMKYIKDLQKKIEQLSVLRDETKSLNINLSHESSSEKLNSCAPTYVAVRPCFAGVEVVINSSSGEQVFQLSRVFELLLEAGLDVASCIYAKVNQRVIYTIQSKVRHMTSVDLNELQNKLIESIPSSMES